MKEIDEKVYGLAYDPEQILAFKGDSISNYVPNEGKLDGDKYIVIKREKRNLKNANTDIAVVSSVADRTYPGALLLANEKLVDNMPDGLVAKRAPLTLRINLPNMGADGTVAVQNPTYSAITEGVNKMLEAWNQKYASKNSINANYSYMETEAFSEDQLSVILGCNFKLLQKQLNVDFNAISKDEKKVHILCFKQIFYTVSIDNPTQPSDMFADDVTWDELTKKGVDNDNPPAFVSNVSYGRTIYVKLEANDTSLDIKAALDAAIRDNKIDLDTKYKTVLNSCEYTAIVLGGDAETHAKVVTKDFGEIEKIITDNAVYSQKNPGFPISYTSVFLKKNQLATINSSTEYVETTTTEYTSGSMKLHHSGGYVAKFYVDWKERSFNEAGEEVLAAKSWGDNDKKKTASFSTVIPLPANATNIHVKAIEQTGLAWEPWRTVVDQDVPLCKEISVSISGTTLSPKGSVEYKYE